MSSWIEDELCRAQFNDKRLNNRFKKLVTELAENPSESINSASIDWASTKATYRFFDNPNIESKKIISPHFEATALRCSNYERIIIAQDTTFIDFTKHKKTKNLTKGFNSHGVDVKGIFQHVGLAMSDKGLPLGLVYNKIWNRKEVHQSDYERLSLPMQLKESWRWLDCLKKSKELLSNQNIVVVSDREGDLYEAFEEAYDLNVDVVIRSQHNRVLEGDLKLIESLSLLNSVGAHKITIPGSGSRKKVIAKLDIRFTKVELKARANDTKTQKNKSRQDLELYVVDASDPKNDINWRLLTTIPVDSKKNAIDILNIYSKRWNVELYFKSLKSGCSVGDCRLGEAGKLIKYISLMSVIAWRVFWINFVSRESPHTNSEKVFMKSEWKTAWLMLHRRKIKEGKMNKNEMPKIPPTIREVTHWIAGLGGFLRRKGDGEPGIITFWRGWNKLQNGLEIYELMA